MRYIRFTDRDEAARCAAAVDCLLGYPRTHAADEPGVSVARGARLPYTETQALIADLGDGTYAYPLTLEMERLLDREVEVRDRDGRPRVVRIEVGERALLEAHDLPEHRTELPPRDGLEGSERGRLEEVRVMGLCSLNDVAIRPGRLTVLIGANGSGKSNVLRALRMVALMRTGSLQRFVAESGGAAALLHYGPKRTNAIRIELDFVRNDIHNRYAARLGFAAGDKLAYLDESVGYQPRPNATMTVTSLGAGHWESELHAAKSNDITARTLSFWLSRLTFFHFHDTSMTSALRTHARAEDDQFLRSDGSNLAAYLARLEASPAEADQKAWRRINQFVGRVAPSVKALCPTPADRKSSSVRLDWVDDQDERFGAHQLSDGTLRAIALITALAQPTERLPMLVSIDEPELGLHPAAIALLAELARSVSRHTQVVFATQSTAFLDHFEPEEVVVVERENGASGLRRLDPGQLATWLEDYSLSEVFDKGVIGGRP